MMLINICVKRKVSTQLTYKMPHKIINYTINKGKKYVEQKLITIWLQRKTVSTLYYIENIFRVGQWSYWKYMFCVLELPGKSVDISWPQYIYIIYIHTYIVWVL